MSRRRAGGRAGASRTPVPPAVEPLRVAFSSDAPDHAESAAIRAWLSSAAGTVAETVPLGTAAGAGADVLWIHGVDPVPLEALGVPGPQRLPRGRLLLTGGAVTLPAAAGMDAAAPNDAVRLEWNDPADGLTRLRGHASFRGHPLLEGLGAGTYTWSPVEGEPYTRVSYVRPTWPTGGRVVAVERTERELNARRATIWEYDGERGRTLCIGAYIPFHSPELRFRAELERLALNALRRAATPPDPAEESGTWRVPDIAAREDRGLAIPELPLLEDPLGGIEFRLRASGPAAPDAPFTVAGRRACVSGGAARGIDEVWAHPVRLATGPRVAGAVAETVTVTPIAVERRLRLEGALILERVVVPREAPVCLVEWQARGGAAQLEVEWMSDLRIASPYPADAVGPLRWRTAARGLVLASATGDEAVFAFSRAPALLEVEDASEADRPRVRTRARFRLRSGDSVRLALVAGTGESPLRRALAAADRGEAITRARQGQAEQLLTDRLALDAPDPGVSQAVDWAKQRLGSYLAESAGLGRSLLTGYCAAPVPEPEGPDRAPRFGADAAWAALACLATGDFATVRDVLAFLGRHQDLSGRIPYECTTSGSVEHDADHATPLYLLLIARYLAWTADLRFVRSEWPRILRAYAYGRRSDRDGDGLIEATRPAHGTPGDDRAGGSELSLYTATVWTAALRELADAAEAIGERGAAVELRSAGTRARAALERAFLVPETSAWALDLRREGERWRRNMVQTATHAVPLLLGCVDTHRMQPWLDAVAGDAFTAPWGVRILPATDPRYQPGGAGGGAVRPLYTGWASWAEYAGGRPESGYRHWRMNVDLAFRNQLGAWDRVLRGDEPVNPGGCGDDAGSTAMVVLPLVHGLLGAEPDAAKGRLVLRPRPPADWSRFTVARLAVGDASVTLSYRRDGGRHRIRIGQERGAVPLRVILEPALPGTRLRSALVDRESAELDWRPLRDRIATPVQVVLDHPREIVLELE